MFISRFLGLQCVLQISLTREASTNLRTFVHARKHVRIISHACTHRKSGLSSKLSGSRPLGGSIGSLVSPLSAGKSAGEGGGLGGGMLQREAEWARNVQELEHFAVRVASAKLQHLSEVSGLIEVS